MKMTSAVTMIWFGADVKELSTKAKVSYQLPIKKPRPCLGCA